MLYQQCRPRNLDEFVGNKSTVSALRAMIRRGSIDRPHAILLCGPTGCGKTTLARILAKEFGCTGLGIVELNAANTRGIDTIRDLARTAAVTPIGSDAKTYILDESHMLTGTAQQALLKIIEDCPKDCYFIFCTTEPQNIIKTVRNRCTEFSVGLLSRKLIVEVLEDACDPADLSDPVSGKDLIGLLETIAEVAEGSPRTALVLLEKVMGLTDEEEILDVLVRGTEEEAGIWDLCNYLKMGAPARRKKWQLIIETAYLVEEESESVRRAILSSLMKELKNCTREEKAIDLAGLLQIFSMSTFYGGKPQLMSLVTRACFGNENNK